jgi:serine/threonine protein kinase, bacterial
MIQNKASRIRRRCGAIVAAAAMATLTVAGPAYAAAGDVTTLAGSGTGGSADGTGVAASFNYPAGVAVDGAGNVYVADSSSHKIRKVSPGGVVSTLAGSGTAGAADGTGAAASFNSPTGVAADGAGNVYVADYGNNKIRKVSPAGVVSTLAGSGSQGSVDGTGAAASFDAPRGVAVDSSGNVYVADYGNNKIRKVSSAGVVSTLAGSGTAGAVDGTGAAASFSNPFGVAVDGAGNVFVADTFSNKIRKVTSAGVVSTLAGSGTGGAVDGTGAAASFDSPTGVAVDGAGSVFVADSSNNKIRKVTSGGVVSTLAGSGTAGAVNGTGAAASFDYPAGVAVDGAGNVFVGDTFNNKIRKVEADSAGVSMVQPLPLLVAGFGVCVGGVIVQSRRRRSSRPTLTPTF